MFVREKMEWINIFFNAIILSFRLFYIFHAWWQVHWVKRITDWPTVYLMQWSRLFNSDFFFLLFELCDIMCEGSILTSYAKLNLSLFSGCFCLVFFFFFYFLLWNSVDLELRYLYFYKHTLKEAAGFCWFYLSIFFSEANRSKPFTSPPFL